MPMYLTARSRPRRTLFSGFLALMLTGLIACSARPQVERYSHSLSVSLNPGDTVQQIKNRYQGDIIVWRPEAGFAILGFHERDDISLQSDADTNQNAVGTPEVAASGLETWSSAYNAWGGGWSARLGEDNSFTTFEENLPLWDQINLSEAHDLSPALGKGVKVAVIDTGFDLRHPAFIGKLTPEHEWMDFVGGDSYPQEERGAVYGHGSGVAGVILQVAPNVTLLPIRVLRPDGTGDLTDVAAAIDWAISQDAQIINLSLGSNADFKTLKEMIKYAKKRDVALVASAGNRGDDKIEFPARYRNEVVSVGSVDRFDIKSSFSAYGKELELLAPGEHIYTSAPNNHLAAWSGTSFAAPIVTGALALALGEAELSGDRKLKDIEKQLIKTSEDVSKRGRNRNYKELAKGRLKIDEFLLELGD